ncbi:amino acid synthesis family protein [Amycolatopsis acidiphila]|uniref:Amino acid synthesis family protein n=1 Tax=Amycolatopsis acidiphila TaxID=715473 RepID=A0A558AJ29_9PSEU|nr:amino acid synthesis family protein [Amycolatopsis acidiphila]TVT24274.1 amino acid synthesis family protein [Amycolatopsis acidiphila]UIJ62596.1 amino acid synthesis family protein [Amycolatopsis acidiphila]GHG85657.1 peptide synthetase [Amycolatopsis acidiphila]
MTDPIRKIVTRTEVVLAEGGQPLDRPWRKAVAAAVITNPWLHQGHVSDLGPEVKTLAPKIASALATSITRALGGADNVEAFGKAALVGLDGEVEHGAALIHTPFLGDLFRHIVEGESIIAFGESQAPAGTVLTVPMWHKTAASTRSHYQAVNLSVSDAPRADEILIALGVSAGPRPLARIGDRRTDTAIDPTDILSEVHA